ncbi:hypothetical protein V8E36_001567 [Tilletia maclaganii]
MQEYGQDEGKIGLGEDAALLLDHDNEKSVGWGDQERKPSGQAPVRSRLVRNLILLVMLPLSIFLLIHAWGPPPPRHHHHRWGPHHGKPQPPPRHHPTPVQCEVISKASPTLNLSLDPVFGERPGKHQPTKSPLPPPPPPFEHGPGRGKTPGEHKKCGKSSLGRPRGPPPSPPGPRPGFFLHPSLSGVQSLSILRNKPVQPLPELEHGLEDKDPQGPPRPEPIKAQIVFEDSGNDLAMIDVQRMINLAQHGDKAAELEAKKIPQLHICIMHGAPGSVGLSAFPEDPTKHRNGPDGKARAEANEPGRDQHGGPPPPPAHRPPPPFDAAFAELVNKLTIKLHLPAHFPPAGVDINLGPSAPPHHHRHHNFWRW